MKHNLWKYRLKISNRLAALAATLLLLTSVAGPGLNQEFSELQVDNTDAEGSSLVEESISEMVGVSPVARAPRNFNISSLIFRF